MIERLRSPLLVPAACVAVFSAVAVLPFVVGNELAAPALSGHLAAARFTREQLWPSFFGWNPYYYCGAPQNQLYPPLVLWTAATLGVLVGVPLGVKLIAAAAVLLLPPAAWACARGAGLGARPAAAATLAVSALLALDGRDLGATLTSTLVAGRLGAGLGLPLFLFYTAALARLRRGGRALGPTLLAALLVLTDLVSALLALAYLVLDCLFGDGPRRPRLVHGAAALATTAWFWLPLLVRQGYGSPDVRSLFLHPDSLLAGLVAFALLVAWFASRRPDRRALAVPAALSGLLVLARQALFNDWLPARVALPIDRLEPFAIALLAIIACWLADGTLARLSRRRALGAAVAALALVALPAARIDTSGPRTPALPRLAPLASRVLVVGAPAVQELVPLASGVAGGEGRFPAAAAHARRVLDLEQLIDPEPARDRSAASALAVDSATTLAVIAPRAAERMRQLGFGGVLSDTVPRIPGLVRVGDAGAGFTLWGAGEAPLAEVWRAPIERLAPARFDDAAARWLFDGGTTLSALADDRPWPAAPAAAALAAASIAQARFDASGQAIFVDVRASEPVPVLIKVTWFPNWSARDLFGRELPLYRVAPGFMLLWAQGPTFLRYQATLLDRLAGAFSFAVAGALLAAALAAWTLRARRRTVSLAIRVSAIVIAIALGALVGARLPFAGAPAGPALHVLP